MSDPSGQKPSGQGPEIRIPDPVQFSRDFAEIAERSQRLVLEFLQGQGQQSDGIGMADPLNIGQAFLEMTQRLMADPGKLMQAQVTLWQDYMKLWQRPAERFLGGSSEPM